jgi:hypothetical protein
MRKWKYKSAEQIVTVGFISFTQLLLKMSALLFRIQLTGVGLDAASISYIILDPVPKGAPHTCASDCAVLTRGIVGKEKYKCQFYILIKGAVALLWL